MTVETLSELLEQVRDGTIHIPEFQRECVLEDEWIKSLLASVSLSYPIGAVTLLETGNPDLRFATHRVAGTPPSATEPERLVIDGQRRVTALYQVLASGRAVELRDAHEGLVRRWYYVDMEQAVDPHADRDDTIVSLSEPGTVESEWAQRRFPLRLVFGADAELQSWRAGFAEHGAALMQQFETSVLDAFRSYRLPTIIVGREWARWSVRVHGGPEGRTLSDRFRVH